MARIPDWEAPILAAKQAAKQAHHGRKRPRPGIVKGGLQQQPLPEIGTVRFRAVGHEDMGLVAELRGDVLASGYGEFGVTDRAGNVGITGYTGRKPLSLEIPLLFDRWSSQASVEDEVRMLERMHGLDDVLDQPPAIIIEGFGVPHSYSRAPNYRFAFNGDIQWDDSDIRYRSSDGHRLYVACTVTAILLVRPMSLAASTAPAADSSATRHSYTVPKTGHPRTLRGIAKKFGKDWHAVRALNPRLPGDPDKALKAGAQVRYA